MEPKQTNLTEVMEWSAGFEKVELKDGLYPAAIKEIETFTAKYGECKRLIFEITATPKNVEMAYSCYPKPTASSKMGKLLLALGFEEGKPVSFKDMIGKPCQAFIKNVEIDKEKRPIISDILKK